MYQVNTMVEKLGKPATYQQLMMKVEQSIAGKKCPECLYTYSTVYLGIINNEVVLEQISGR